MHSSVERMNLFVDDMRVALNTEDKIELLVRVKVERDQAKEIAKKGAKRGTRVTYGEGSTTEAEGRTDDESGSPK